jgi:hypothetical protein
MEGYPSSAKSFSHSSFSEVGELYGGVREIAPLAPTLPARCTGLAVAAAVHLSPACGAGKMLRGYFGVECIKSRGLVRRDGRASKECLHTGVSAGLRRSPIRRIDADERLLQCAYREPDADREPQANRQPDDEPFASITHGDTSCAPARPATTT